MLLWAGVGVSVGVVIPKVIMWEGRELFLDHQRALCHNLIADMHI